MPVIFLSSTTAGEAGAPLLPIETPASPALAMTKNTVVRKDRRTLVSRSAPCRQASAAGRDINSPRRNIGSFDRFAEIRAVATRRLRPEDEARQCGQNKGSMHMADLSFVVDSPARDGVEVVVSKTNDRRH